MGGLLLLPEVLWIRTDTEREQTADVTNNIGRFVLNFDYPIDFDCLQTSTGDTIREPV
jgi:hypothetical protein